MILLSCVDLSNRFFESAYLGCLSLWKTVKKGISLIKYSIKMKWVGIVITTEKNLINNANCRFQGLVVSTEAFGGMK